jgi:hypothetical protein
VGAEPLGKRRLPDRRAARPGVDQRLARMRLIAGGAPGPVERLRRSEEALDDIVRRWRRPARVNPTNVRSAESLVSRIYDILEDEIPTYPNLWEAYVGVRPYVEQRHDVAMDAIAWFRRVQDADPAEALPRELRRVQDDTGALVETRRTMIVAVREFHGVAKPLIDELERITKSPFPDI